MGGWSLRFTAEVTARSHQPAVAPISPRYVVEMLLDCGKRTLSVYLNGSRRGVMVVPGIKDWKGDAHRW
eukprot:COSAG06_NODE_49152_length_327_cov_0.903509_1_plen_68_part_01